MKEFISSISKNDLLSVEEKLDKDGDLKINMECQSGYFYLSKVELASLIIHLNKVLEEK